MSFVLTLILGGFGLVCTGAGAYGFLQYYRYSRYPLREPTEVSEGDVVGMEGTVTSSSPTAPAPISGEEVVAVHVRIDGRSGMDQQAWETIEEGVTAVEEVVVDCAGYEVLVELPGEVTGDELRFEAFDGGLERSEVDYHEIVEPDEEPPSEIDAFERTAGRAFDVGNRRKRYMEAHLEPGDAVTLYGRVGTTSGDTASPSNLKLSAEDSPFELTTQQHSDSLKQYYYGGIWGLVLGLPPLAAAILL